MGLILNCQACGEPMPPMDEDTAKLLRGVKGVTLKHEVCPRDQEAVAERAAATRPRRFEARVRIVEVLPAAVEGGDVTLDEIAGLTAWVDATSLAEAARPLALDLGERWQEFEKHAGIADE